ncbi:OLC1v1039178C1 [Oldenlandia corymbosa var. corymbosa]|uniref:Short-chain dehydrogenase/reductase n=1 Tax=Oldenlandia corymbosa var. corymbosa TaxID=529605 RepID=A0AAV1D442_OLDCO|nr:OLC1v1039178C1 [Oldenlandia corymbosa var. corymbosa]
MAERRIAVVTGGNKGIGFEICKQLASQGVTVVLTARDEKRGNEAVEKLVEDSGISDKNVIFHQLDVMDPKSMATLFDFINSKFGKLDILINNAGIGGVTVEGDVSIYHDQIMADFFRATGQEVPEIRSTGKLIQTCDLAEECLKTNYYGVKQMTEAFIPLMQSSSLPRIVNISSFLGKLELLSNEWAKKVLSNGENLTAERVDEVVAQFLKDFKEGTAEVKGWPTAIAAYKVSKSALNGYTRILSKTYPGFCINCVCPGYCSTDINCHTGFLTSAEGAEAPVMLALLPNGGPSGSYFLGKEVTTF